MLQGDGVPKKLTAPFTTDSEELMQVPWSAHAGGHALTSRAESVDRDLDSLDSSDEDFEFVPYCVMPHVERLLQVGKQWCIPELNAAIVHAWPNSRSLGAIAEASCARQTETQEFKACGSNTKSLLQRRQVKTW